MMKRTFFAVSILVLFACLPVTAPLHAEESSVLSIGQTIYVPAYSHIYIGSRERPYLLTVTVSIRNVDLKYPVTVTTVDYYETQGRLLQRFLEKPVTLLPLESVRYVIPEKDKTGGSGANFIVEWEADRLVNAPIVETVMIGTQAQQGISFTSRGRAIRSKD